MNEMWKVRLCSVMLSLVAAGTIATAGCGGGGGGGGSAPSIPSLVGTWKEASISGNSQTTPCPGTIAGLASCGTNDNLQFTSNGTVTNQFLDATSADPARMYIETGTYAVVSGQAGFTLTVNYTQGGDDTNHNGLLDANEVLPASAFTANVGITFPDATHFALQLTGPTETDNYAKQ